MTPNSSSESQLSPHGEARRQAALARAAAQQGRQTLSDRAAASLKEARARRRWSLERLASECAAIGATWLTEAVLKNIESGRPGRQNTRRREITLDEISALAFALNVAPLHLLLGVEDGDEPEKEIWITPDLAVSPDLAREWWRGRARREVLVPMGIDPRLYESFVPASEYGQKEKEHGEH
jgi:transcriptional regulator with XRE-family HTH domain